MVISDNGYINKANNLKRLLVMLWFYDNYLDKKRCLYSKIDPHRGAGAIALRGEFFRVAAAHAFRSAGAGEKRLYGY